MGIAVRESNKVFINTEKKTKVKVKLMEKKVICDK